jgi:hypothetical protein
LLEEPEREDPRVLLEREDPWVLLEREDPCALLEREDPRLLLDWEDPLVLLEREDELDFCELDFRELDFFLFAAIRLLGYYSVTRSRTRRTSAVSSPTRYPALPTSTAVLPNAFAVPPSALVRLSWPPPSLGSFRPRLLRPIAMPPASPAATAPPASAGTFALDASSETLPRMSPERSWRACPELRVRLLPLPLDERLAADVLDVRPLVLEPEREAFERERLDVRRAPFALLVPLLDREPLAPALLREALLARLRLAPLLFV